MKWRARPCFTLAVHFTQNENESIEKRDLGSSQGAQGPGEDSGVNRTHCHVRTHSHVGLLVTGCVTWCVSADVTSTGGDDVTSMSKDDVTSTGGDDVTSMSKDDVTSTGWRHINRDDVTSTGWRHINRDDVTSTGWRHINRDDVTSTGMTSRQRALCCCLRHSGLGTQGTAHPIGRFGKHRTRHTREHRQSISPCKDKYSTKSM